MTVKAKVVAQKACDGVRYVVSSILTLGGMAFITYGIIKGLAVLTPNPILPFVILISMITLLGFLEGLQVAILALEGRDGEDFKASHPRGYRLHMLANRPMNVQRFLVGRQFFVIFVVMLMSQVTTFPDFE